jgi:hypothetical protein
LERLLPFSDCDTAAHPADQPVERREAGDFSVQLAQRAVQRKPPGSGMNDRPAIKRATLLRYAVTG